MSTKINAIYQPETTNFKILGKTKFPAERPLNSGPLPLTIMTKNSTKLHAEYQPESTCF
jgi:hypothetical protein